MARFSLSISSAYVPDWGVAEGVREVIQNGLDGRQDGHPLTIDHHNGTLSVSNAGVRLERSVWLMGASSKTNGRYIGHWGEGLALGALALVRAGRRLRIVNDDEAWLVRLQPDPAFCGQQLLTITTRQLRRATGRFSVEIELSDAEWQQQREAFLDLTPPRDAIDGGLSRILLDPSHQGRCYVKGILVESRTNLAAGYDFSAASTDRDRRMINGFDFDYYTAAAWLHACREGHRSADQLLDLLEGGTADAKGLAERSTPEEILNAVAQAYAERHGHLAIPVASYAEANEAGHAGRIGVIATPALCGFFSSHPSLSLQKLRSERRAEIAVIYGEADLTPPERAIRSYGIQLVEAASVPLGFQALSDRLEIVAFRSDEILGINTSTAGGEPHPIRIARRSLASLEQFLRVLVHELAHDRGGDGDVRHERAEGEIFSRLIALALSHGLACGTPPAAALAAPTPALACVAA
ncbi:MAG: hypothetical protein VKJ05_08200 [Synechococcaceae cyanobacterium]|nr:hypothetical protein [Synechococcaceae cyanobacterium]